MQHSEEDCIRYLMKEMDPSEELLMERAMMSDEDLLIEVESMRQTLQKMDKLPQVDPPKDVTEAVMKKASEQADENRKSGRANVFLKYAVAATVVLTVSASGAWYFVGSQNSDGRTVQATQQQVAGQQTSSDINKLSGALNMRQEASQATASSQSDVEPWVDRNDVLRFNEEFSSSNSKFQAIIEQATQKLKPLEHSQSIIQDRVNNVQLTGAKK